MGLFSDLKKKLEELFPNAEASTPERLQQFLKERGLDFPGVRVEKEGDQAVVSGEVPTQADKNNIVLALGNAPHIDSVVDRLTVAGVATSTAATSPITGAPRFYTVKSGDTLSAISKQYYGDANKYNKIFEANRSLLSDANDIHPGQKLLIPE